MVFFLRRKRKKPATQRSLMLLRSAPSHIQLPRFSQGAARIVYRSAYALPPQQKGHYAFFSNSGPTRDEYSKPSIITVGTDYLRSIEHAKVFPGTGIIFSGGGFYWQQSEFQGNQFAKYPRDSRLVAHFSASAIFRNNESDFRERYFSNAISLIGSLHWHFGHFAFGLVPQLRHVFMARPELEGVPILISEDFPIRFRALLRHIGLTNPLVEVGNREVAQVENLFRSEDLRFFPDHLEVPELEVQRERTFHYPEFSFLFSRRHENKTGLISLLRHNTLHAGYRRLSNVSEVDAVVAGFGGRSLNPSELSFAVLAENLAGAKAIVVENGSLLANLLLCGIVGATVIVLSHPHVGQLQHGRAPGFLSLVGNDVVCIEGESAHVTNKQSDWTIDVSLITSALKSRL
ncbi:glycosyltransferase family 61 protein [Pontimonas sp.]|nr:glycosyltransferase family 61 protein [Pontimonas sp.]